MPAERTIPVAAGQREFVVKINGEAIPRQQHLLVVSVQHGANKLSRARLVYQDGAAASSDFPLSNDEFFVPGNEIEILAGAAGEEQSIFSGIVIKQALKVRENTAPQLVIDCRHKAIAMTRSAKSAYFLEQTDSDVISSLLDQYQVAGTVTATDTEHEQLVQYAVSDWDFCLLRAALNGQLLIADGDSINSVEPDTSGDPVIVLQFGSTILEMDIEVDARHQHQAMKGVVWDPAGQEAVEVESSDPGIASPGNLSSPDLASTLGDGPTESAPGAAGEAELQNRVDADLARSQLNLIGARLKCEGMTEVTVGDAIQIDGAGERFSGNAYVTALRQDYDLIKGWKTTLQIGGVRQVFEQVMINQNSSGSGYIAPTRGLCSGVVLSNEDPNGEFRVKVAIPSIGLGEEGLWARVASLDAGENRGMLFRPEPEDEVVVGFFDQDPRAPVIVGMLHSSAKPAPLEPSDDNHEKGFVSRSEMKILFDDDQNIMRFETPEGNAIALDEAEGGLTITDQNGNSIALTSDGIKIESAAALELIASTEIKSESGTETKLEAGTELKLDSSLGSALSSSATTEVKGSLVQIN